MIASIDLDPNLCRECGLTPVGLRNLGDVVAIAGPNGSGKSRLLRLLADQWQPLRDMGEWIRANTVVRLGETSEARKRRLEPLELDVRRVLAGESLRARDTQLSDHHLQALGRVRETMQFHASYDEVFRLDAWLTLVRIINDPRKSEHDYRNTGEPVRNLRESAARRLQTAAWHQYMSHHPLWKQRHESELAASTSFFSTVSELLGVQCGWTIFLAQNQEHIVPTFNGRIAAEDELSEGQRVILRWCELIHDQVSDLRQAIILLDEPELHLHPDLLRRTIARLRALEPAQLWIATHSLPLLADLGVRNLYEMRDGQISWAGNRTLDVQRSLLGPDGADNLRTFLADAATVAFHQFAAESLLQPAVVPLRGNDPQAAQFTNHLSQLLSTSTTTTEVHVLDYAAGSGRLIEAIASLPAETRTHLRYHAFCDPDFTTPAQRDACRTQLARLHPDATDAFLHTDLRALQRTDATKMHAVVLSNVLHEIPPTEWPRLMADIADCLAPDGWLLLLEDQRMNVGELPHDKGFLVLDEVELRDLFGVSDRDPDALRFATLDDRLSLVQVSRAVLRNCNGPRVQSALGLLAKRSLDHVRRLRRASPDPADHRRGRAHAYYAMLHTNATLALERPG